MAAGSQGCSECGHPSCMAQAKAISNSCTGKHDINCQASTGPWRLAAKGALSAAILPAWRRHNFTPNMISNSCASKHDVSCGACSRAACSRLKCIGSDG
eukprot:1145431-Pelagomonas_calceolata.AAC.6